MNTIEDILYPRQIEVLELIALGMTVKEIGFALNVSSKTAEHHRAEIYHALNLSDPIMLTHFAIQHDIVPLIKIPMPKERKPTRRAEKCFHGRKTCGVKKIVNPFGEVA